MRLLRESIKYILHTIIPIRYSNIIIFRAWLSNKYSKTYAPKLRIKDIKQDTEKPQGRAHNIHLSWTKTQQMN